MLFTPDPCHYLSVDPGTTSGWASFTEEAKLADKGVAKEHELPDLLKATAPKIIIVENFKLRPWMAAEQSWSEFPAPKVIGALEFYANLAGAELIKQEPSVKEIGYKWSGLKKAKSHKNSHDQDAYAHAVYYFIKNKIRNPTAYLKGGING